jgi:6-phosphogluconate dehydrogenase
MREPAAPSLKRHRVDHAPSPRGATGSVQWCKQDCAPARAAHCTIPRMEKTFGIIGLGVMGENLALNFMDHGTPVAVWNLETEWTDRFVKAHPEARGAKTLAELVEMLPRPRRMLMMIKAGKPVDMTLATLKPLLSPGDVVIDGGNSFFKDTQRREADYRAAGLNFVGMGVSGGEDGARRGPSLMPGGTKEAWQTLQPQLEAISAKTESGPCVTYVGPDGAGHFVKMVHNGIEYGDMQLIAEVYDLLRKACRLDAPKIAALFDQWNRGPLESFLIELSADVLRKKDEVTGKWLVDMVLDEAGQKGTGKWAAQVALDMQTPIPTIAAAIDARNISDLKRERVAAAKLFAPITDGDADAAALMADLPGALYTAKICSYAQGMALIAAGSHEHKWDVDLGQMARIWKGGCIIRARILDEIMKAYARPEPPANLILDEGLREHMNERALRRVVAAAARLAIPAPALSSSLAYLDAYRTAELPQNLTQAQRDAFGAHTYQRADDASRKFVHTEWTKLR